VHIVAAVFFRKDLSISRHQHRHRIRQKKNLGSYDARGLVRTRMSNPGIFQVDSVHQVMQCDVRVTAAQAHKRRSKKTHKGDQRIVSECTEQQIEPDHVWFQPSHGGQQPGGARRIIERPATLDRKSPWFRFG
jgi:hypothetical protein